MPDKTEFKKIIAQIMEVLPQIIRGFQHTQGNALSRGQISEPQYFTLEAIDRQGAMKMGELAEELSASLPAMSGLIDRLYKIKCVKRIYTEKDRRVIRISITKKGKNILKTIQIQRAVGFEKIFSQLSQTDRIEYLRIITKVRNILNENSKKQG